MGVGSLGAALARRYGNALLDTDLTGGHGDATVRALTATGYYRLNNWDPSAVHLGQGDQTLGFKMNAGNRAEMVAAIQQALLDDSLICHSEGAVRSLMEVAYVMTPGGKERPEASYGAKDEDMICMGRFLHLHSTTAMPKRRTITPQERLSRLTGGRRLLGRDAKAQLPHILWQPRR